MNIKVIALFLLFCCATYAQQLRKISNYYDKEKKVLKEVFFYNDKTSSQDSSFVSYYISGSKKAEGKYKKDQPTGQWIYYYEQGSVKAIGQYAQNSQNGKWIYYFENGQISMEGEMLNGKKNGEWKNYHENGNLKSTGGYSAGKQDGNWIYFNELGEKKGSAQLKQGNGIYKEYYSSGALKAQGFIKNGMSDSTWTQYYENGALKSAYNERNGLKNGAYKSYYEDGTIAESGSYEKGKPNGLWAYYHKNGKLSAQGSQDNGNKNGKWSYYYDTGNLKGESDFAQGDGDYKEFYPNGKLKAKGKIKNGFSTGHWEYFYESGEKEGEAEYDNGSGEYIGYYSDGTKKMEGKVEDGVKVGTWSLYDEQGVLKGLYKHIQLKEDEPTDTTNVPKKDTLSFTPTNKTPKTGTKPKKYTYNIYKSFIIGANPTALIVNQLPIYIEYYIEKKRGLEIQYNIFRTPFFSNIDKPELNKEYFKGYSITFKDKYYKNPKPKKGMWYIAYDLRYSNLNQSLLSNDSLTNQFKEYSRKAQSVEVSAQFGDRFIKTFDKPAFTFDFYLGLGIGYKNLSYNYDPKETNTYHFKTKITEGFYIPLRIGFNVGYLF